MNSLLTSAQTPEVPTATMVADSFPIKFDYNRDFRRLKAMSEDKGSPYYFQSLISRFLENDSSLTRPEVLVLMIGFTDNNHFKPLENMEIEKEIIELNDEGYFEDAIEESKKYLKKNPLSLSTNKEISYAYHRMGVTDSAKYFMFRNDLIMEAMIFSGGGKGRTAETAFFSLGLNDGDYFIPNVGFSATNQTLTKDKYKNTIYLVVSMNIESAKTNYFFNIHHAKIKADSDGIAGKKASKVDKARKKRAASKKGKKGKEATDETEESTQTETPTEEKETPNAPIAPETPENMDAQPTDSTGTTPVISEPTTQPETTIEQETPPSEEPQPSRPMFLISLMAIFHPKKGKIK